MHDVRCGLLLPNLFRLEDQRCPASLDGPNRLLHKNSSSPNFLRSVSRLPSVVRIVCLFHLTSPIHLFLPSLGCRNHLPHGHASPRTSSGQYLAFPARPHCLPLLASSTTRCRSLKTGRKQPWQVVGSLSANREQLGSTGSWVAISPFASPYFARLFTTCPSRSISPRTTKPRISPVATR